MHAHTFPQNSVRPANHSIHTAITSSGDISTSFTAINIIHWIMSSLTQEGRVAKEQKDYEALLEACEDFEAKGPKSCYTAGQLNKMYRDLVKARMQTGRLLARSNRTGEFWAVRNALTIKLSTLELHLLPEADEDSEEDGTGPLDWTQGSATEVSTKPREPTPEVTYGLDAPSLSNRSKILNGSRPSREETISKANSEAQKGFELVLRPSSAGSVNADGENSPEDPDWEMV